MSMNINSIRKDDNQHLLSIRISKEEIDSHIKKIDYHKQGYTHVIAVITLYNGFIVTGEYEATNTDFNFEKGKVISLRKAKENLWQLLSFYKHQKSWEEDTRVVTRSN